MFTFPRPIFGAVMFTFPVLYELSEFPFTPVTGGVFHVAFSQRNFVDPAVAPGLGTSPAAAPVPDLTKSIG